MELKKYMVGRSQVHEIRLSTETGYFFLRETSDFTDRAIQSDVGIHDDELSSEAILFARDAHLLDFHRVIEDPLRYAVRAKRIELIALLLKRTTTTNGFFEAIGKVELETIDYFRCDTLYTQLKKVAKIKKITIKELDAKLNRIRTSIRAAERLRS